MIFVFGSNLAGRHGKGAAKVAIEKHGAIYGQALGRQGNSWAIPTKDEELRPLPLRSIRLGIETFLCYARSHEDEDFLLTPIGTGLAGHSKHNIAKLFKEFKIPANVYLSSTWLG